METHDIESEERKLERLEEALWVGQAQAGDFNAFGRLMNRYEKRVLYYLRRLAPHGDAALDLHQEVWIEALRGLPTLQFPGAFRVWLYRIAHHKAARLVKNEIRRQAIMNSLAETRTPETDATGEVELDAEAVHHALELLPAQQREILTLYYLRDLSLNEIAAVLDCPAGTVKSRLYHAREALRHLIKGEKP